MPLLSSKGQHVGSSNYESYRIVENGKKMGKTTHYNAGKIIMPLEIRTMHKNDSHLKCGMFD